MSLYVVLSPSCHQFKKGAFIEDVDSLCVQEVYAETVDGQLQTSGAVGLAIPKSLVKDCIMKVQKRGMDKSW